TSAVGAAASGPGGWLNATLAICSDLSFGYFSEAVHLTSAKEVRQWLREAHSRTRLGAVPSRVATHPPGPVIFVRWALQGLRRHQGITRVLSFPLRRHALSAKELEALAGSVSSAHPGASWILAATGLVWLLAIGAPLAVAGAFALGAACRDLRTGFLAAALTATIPALHIFMPGIDSWAAAISTWAMATAIWALKSRRVWAAGIAGLVWGVGLQWTFGLAALAPVMLWALWRWRWPRWWQAAAMLAAGLIAAHIPLVVLGYNPIDGFILSMRAQRAIMSERSYLSWIPLNAWDVILFMGPALVGLCTAAWGEDADLLLPVCATLVVLLLMGTTRGEVGRIWCFLMTPAAAAGACVLGRLRESALVLTGAVVVACQLAIAMVYVSYLALVTP
ncbi:MAG: hypothetical protein H5T86_15905, partial [Armatimonadetes bacterium]|nr:hypothetical protein [Armatimonadota bacterium]